MSAQGVPPRLEDMPDDVEPRHVLWELRMVKWELAPMVEFYQRALGVLAVLRWLGPVTTLLLVAILAVLIVRPV